MTLENWRPRGEGLLAAPLETIFSAVAAVAAPVMVVVAAAEAAAEAKGLGILSASAAFHNLIEALV